MRAVILVGGEGRRLRPLTDRRPKPMLTLVDRPFIQHQLDHLKRFGIRDVVFSCGYLPEAIRTAFGDGSDLGMRLAYVVDPVPLGTAGAIRNADGHLGDETVLVLNGDILTDLDLDALVAAHRASAAEATVALTPVEDPSAFGLVRLRDDRSVDAFLEKPRREDLRPGEPFFINAGTYVLEPSALARIPPGVATSIERVTFPAIAGEGGLFGFPSDAYWRDIGTHGSYLAAHHDVLDGSAVTDAPSGAAFVGDGATLHPSADVDATSTIGAGAHVGPGAVVRGSVVGAGARIARGARLEHAIVGHGARIDEGGQLAPGAVVGDGARVGGGTFVAGVVPTDERVQPGRRVAGSAT
ncbi:MAG: NDP-sugar synthase [Actinobacteria bacterium]|nr:NDP-sugar synthase [Actinomycetota bacterium]